MVYVIIKVCFGDSVHAPLSVSTLYLTPDITGDFPINRLLLGARFIPHKQPKSVYTEQPN